MTLRRFCGIDPGLTGGIAIILVEDDPFLQMVKVRPMPIAGKDLDLTALAELLSSKDPTIAVVENVHAMPGQGVTSMFKFGFVTGAVHGVLATLGIPRYLVSPQQWKKVILAGTLKDKQSAIDYCSRIFPSVSLLATPRSKKAHSGMADSLCLAEYCRIMYG
jgi:Holliday junction resolvasome RuvABC endonuclease subunit